MASRARVVGTWERVGLAIHFSGHGRPGKCGKENATDRDGTTNLPSRYLLRYLLVYTALPTTSRLLSWLISPIAASTLVILASVRKARGGMEASPSSRNLGASCAIA